MTWFSILKETRQIASTGIRTKLGNTPLTMGNEDDDKDCCGDALDSFYYLMEDVSTFDWKTAYEVFEKEYLEKYGGVLTHSDFAYDDIPSHAKEVLRQLEKYKQPGYIEEMFIFCSEIEEIMNESFNYYFNIGDTEELNTWVGVEAYNIAKDIEGIFDRWEDCEDEMV